MRAYSIAVDRKPTNRRRRRIVIGHAMKVYKQGCEFNALKNLKNAI